MEQVFPFILIIIGWNPDNTADTMALQHSLHMSVELCEKAGAEFVAERDWMRKGHYRAEYKHICIPAPTSEDYRSLFEKTK